MGFRDFLKDEEALNGFLKIMTVIFAFVVAIILLILMFKYEGYADKIIPLLTFILGALLAGAKDSIWGGKKNVNKK